MSKWTLLAKRETALIERLLRVLGYQAMFGDKSAVRVRRLLVVAEHGLTAQYVDEDDAKERRVHVWNEYQQKGLDYLISQWSIILTDLKNTVDQLLREQSVDAFKQFMSMYFLSRATILYCHDLAVVLEQHGIDNELHQLGTFHDNVETVSSGGWDEAQKFLAAMATKWGVTVKDLLYYTPEEFIGLLERGEKLAQKTLEERQGFYVIKLENEAITFLTGAAAQALAKAELGLEKIDSNITELKGRVACKGFAKGSVRIVNTNSDMELMEKGEILVSIMTTPRLVPAVRKAAAIVTDEGGLTSHAAIVSRELRIPCIVGTKIATRVLKDGDLVEVDADKGIVRIVAGKSLSATVILGTIVKKA